MRPIASILVDFGQAGPATPPPAFPFADLRPSAPDIDVDELVREAEERGYERGRSEGSADQDAASADARAEFDTQLEAKLSEARTQWADEEGARLVARMDKAIMEFRDVIATKVAEVLQSLVEPSIRQRMIEELLDAIELLTRQDATMFLKVEGPSDLLDAIRRQLPGASRSLDLVESDAVDVRVTAQDSVIETRLGAWISGQQSGGES
jgi:hypothetical protein